MSFWTLRDIDDVRAHYEYHLEHIRITEMIAGRGISKARRKPKATKASKRKRKKRK